MTQARRKDEGLWRAGGKLCDIWARIVTESTEQMQSMLRCAGADFQRGEGGGTWVQSSAKSVMYGNLQENNVRRHTDQRLDCMIGTLAHLVVFA